MACGVPGVPSLQGTTQLPSIQTRPRPTISARKWHMGREGCVGPRVSFVLEIRSRVRFHCFFPTSVRGRCHCPWAPCQKLHWCLCMCADPRLRKWESFPTYCRWVHEPNKNMLSVKRAWLSHCKGAVSEICLSRFRRRSRTPCPRSGSLRGTRGYIPLSPKDHPMAMC